MAISAKPVLVIGATGQQGGATARHLLAKGWHVRALVRDLARPAAQTLRQAGAEIVQGDLDDPASLAEAARGAYGVFSVQPAVSGDEREIRQGQNVADAVRAVGVQHLIYTSVQSADGLFQARGNFSKWEIEQYIQKSNLPATILRPATFMDDIIDPRFGVPQGQFRIALKPDVPMRLIAITDIGAFAALAFEQPGRYLGKTIELAGDALRPSQIAATISRILERPITCVQLPIETLRQENERIAYIFEFLNNTTYRNDIPALREQHPGLLDLASWLRKEGKVKFETLHTNNVSDIN